MDIISNSSLSITILCVSHSHSTNIYWMSAIAGGRLVAAYTNEWDFLPTTNSCNAHTMQYKKEVQWQEKSTYYYGNMTKGHSIGFSLYQGGSWLFHFLGFSAGHRAQQILKQFLVFWFLFSCCTAPFSAHSPPLRRLNNGWRLHIPLAGVHKERPPEKASPCAETKCPWGRGVENDNSK